LFENLTVKEKKMGTRSHIGVLQPDGKIKAVYCHFDSYQNLEILIKNYNSFELAMKLLEEGDMSQLGNTLEECEFYSRDRGEPKKDTEARSFSCISDFLLTCHEDYTFLWDGNEWRWRQWSKPLSGKKVNENSNVVNQQQ